MLRAGRGWVNAARVRDCQNSAPAMLANGTRCAENRWTHSKIRLLLAARERMTAPPAQMCFGYARNAAAIHLESRSLETRRGTAARERFPRRPAPAILVISNDEASGQRWLQKMFSPEMAGQMHRPAPQRHLCCWSASRARWQKRSYIRGSSLARRASATLLSPLLALLQFQERVHPIPCRTKATELLASASCAASRTNHKTNSRTDSQERIQSAREKLPQVAKQLPRFSECDYRRPRQALAI
jgi:hypothetical protein